MKLSFCTACMNRFHHLKRTLEPNLANIVQFGNAIEWIVVNYNSQDDMDEGLQGYANFTASGHLTYYRTTDFRYFNHSHAKNLSHFLASGEYVVNLDADNLLYRGGIANILAAFSEQPDAVLRAYGGLVGMKRCHFLALGGYDEDFQGWGYEDGDLVRRARNSGLAYLDVDCLSRRIEHGDEERLRNLDPALLEKFAVKDARQIKNAMNETNGRMHRAKSQAGTIRVNENRIAGRARVTRNFSDQPLEAGWTIAPQR